MSFSSLFNNRVDSVGCIYAEIKYEKTFRKYYHSYLYNNPAKECGAGKMLIGEPTSSRRYYRTHVQDGSKKG